MTFPWYLVTTTNALLIYSASELRLWPRASELPYTVLYKKRILVDRWVPYSSSPYHNSLLYRFLSLFPKKTMTLIDDGNAATLSQFYITRKLLGTLWMPLQIHQQALAFFEKSPSKLRGREPHGYCTEQCTVITTSSPFSDWYRIFSRPFSSLLMTCNAILLRQRMCSHTDEQDSKGLRGVHRPE